MFQKFLRRFLKPRHYWRDIGFDELSELYVSGMFRSLANSLVGLFVPVYLYQQDVPIWQILFFYAVLFTGTYLVNRPVAHLIARYGPKHNILISYFFQIFAMAGMIAFDYIPIPIYFIALLYGIGNAFFFTAFHVDFSKVKHREHGGKELGWMYSMEKIGATLGPIVGGLVGHFWSSQFIFASAIVLLFAGAIPLFLTKEPVQTNQHIDFSTFNLREIGPDLLSYGALVLENSICVAVWPLFIAVLVFKDDPYLKLGSVASLSIVVSILAARTFGAMTDHRKGRVLLRFGASLNAVIHVFRGLVTNYLGVLVINGLNEGVTVAYRMPYTKGMYDAADDHPGYRIVYVANMEAVGCLARIFFYLSAGLGAFYITSGRLLFVVIFIAAGLASLTIMTERYKALAE